MIEASQGWESAEYRDGGRFEEIGGYVRARRVGPFVFVAGTTAVERSGRVHQPGDTGAQTRFVLQRIDAALRAVGSSLDDVVRTRAYLVDMADAGAFARAHREALGHAAPVLTAVGAQLATPGLMVEVEVDAITGPRAPSLSAEAPPPGAADHFNKAPPPGAADRFNSGDEGL